jgi:hypothetical protein
MHRQQLDGLQAFENLGDTYFSDFLIRKFKDECRM